MTDLLKVLERFHTDATKETDGVWDELEVAPGVVFEVKIASTESRAYRNRILQALREDGMPETDDEADRVMARHMAGTVLTDWRLEWGGEPVPFTEEGAAELLYELRAFREGVMSRARDRSRFRSDNLDKVAERLGKNLSGGSNTATSSASPPSKKGSKRATKPKAGTTG